MKVLIIDSGGMVGHVVALYFKEQGHEVNGYNETPSEIVNTIVGSLYDTHLLTKTIKNGKYNAIVNCSAVINQNAEDDKATAAYVNAYIPHFLESITAGTETVLVHRSTDCVFSGEKGSYTVEDPPDADSFYARTKAVGEVINDKDITIRTSLIGPEYIKDGTGLFNWFINQSGDVKGFTNAIWTGLTTIEFAREIEKLLTEQAHGLFQLVPNRALGKYDLLLLFNKYFPGDRKVIRIDNRRVDKSLVQTTNGYNLQIPDYEPMIKEMDSWIDNHKELYTFY